MPETRLLTAREAAGILKVSPRTVVRWVGSGRLVAAQQLPGGTGALLFREADVEALLAPAPSSEGTV